jgi:hypothetical protein
MWESILSLAVSLRQPALAQTAAPAAQDIRTLKSARHCLRIGAVSDEFFAGRVEPCNVRKGGIFILSTPQQETPAVFRVEGQSTSRMDSQSALFNIKRGPDDPNPWGFLVLDPHYPGQGRQLQQVHGRMCRVEVENDFALECLR